MRATLEIATVPQLNLVVAWVWLCLAFVSGLLLGLFFHGENWLGGYGSFRRRLYRLAHISFFGLGMVNLAFYLTAKETALTPTTESIAGWCFVTGAVAMPLCCVLMAHFPRTRLLFGVPVMSLLSAGSFVMVGLVHPAVPASPQTVTSHASAEWVPSNLDSIQSSNVSTLVRFSASTVQCFNPSTVQGFNTSTLRIP